MRPRSDKIGIDQLKTVESQIGLIGIEITQLDHNRRPEPGRQRHSRKAGKAMVDAGVDKNPMFPEVACGAYQFADRARCDHGVWSSKKAAEQDVPDASGFARR